MSSDFKDLPENCAESSTPLEDRQETFCEHNENLEFGKITNLVTGGTKSFELQSDPSTSADADIFEKFAWVMNESALGNEHISLSDKELDAMIHYEVPLECVVEIESFNHLTLIDSSIKSMNSTNMHTIKKKQMQNRAESSRKAKEEHNRFIPNSSATASSSNEVAKNRSVIENNNDLIHYVDLVDDADSEKYGESEINKTKANGNIIVIDSDEGNKMNESEESQNDAEVIVYRPITRSRVKDEVDLVLRKKVMLGDSDMDDDDDKNDSDFQINETASGKTSKVGRKRVCSSSSEDSVLQNSSGPNDGSSSEQSFNSAAKTTHETQLKNTKSIKKTKPAKKKKRKVAFDSDDERSLLGSDNEAKNLDGSDQNAFRNRKMISKKKLAKTTIDAEIAEKERRKRLKEKQKEFNGIEMTADDESGEMEMFLADRSVLAPKLKSLVLDRDENGNPPQPVQVHSSLVSMLKPHQAEGLVFMYNCLFESTERFNANETFGGILAHCMGLGKTFQVIAFLHTVMSHPKLCDAVKHVMIVGPKNVVNNWTKEFQKWLYNVDSDLDIISVYNLSLYTRNEERKEIMKEWRKSKKPSVLIITYEMFRMLTETDEDKPKQAKVTKRKKSAREKKLEKMKVDFRIYLQNPGPDLIICDEGHKLKSDDTGVFKTMAKIQTRRRLCLTGTPMQNNLNEYYTMVSFVKPGLLGTKQEFANRFGNIISRGHTIDASAVEILAMKKRSHVLYEYLSAVVQRRDYRVLIKTIPPKQEYVIYVRMTPRQCALYRGFLQNFVNKAELKMRRRLLPDYHIFSRIWTHPFALVLHEQEVERRRILEDNDDFVVSNEEESEAEGTSSDSNNNSDINEPSTSTANMPRRSTRQNPINNKDDDIILAEDNEVASGWYSELNLISKSDEFAYELGNKLVLLQQIIKKCEEIGDKILIFSQSLESLRIIRYMLEYLSSEDLWFVDGHEALRAEGEDWGWVNGIDYLVIDGSVSSKGRDYVQDQFNDPLNFRARLMLISTLAGSLGTNLVTANRVVIFDACWNPSHDTQAMFRVYRYGQVKPVYIYRFIAQGTMEERIYKRQVTKESTARRVTEEASLQRHFRDSDLYALYEFDPDEEDLNPSDNQARLAPPKDRLLADVIRSHGYAIVNYLQHDSLFNEVDEEKLSEEDRLAAWEDYENNKDKPSASIYLPAMHQPTSLPPHLMILPNNSPELFGLTTGAQTDHVYKLCFALPQMTNDIALRVLFIKRLLDRIMPLIPTDLRGGINEFDSYFANTIHDSLEKKQTAIEFLERSISVFKTTIEIVRNVPSCAKLIQAFHTFVPALMYSANPSV